MVWLLLTATRNATTATQLKVLDLDDDPPPLHHPDHQQSFAGAEQVLTTTVDRPAAQVVAAPWSRRTSPLVGLVW